MLVFCELVSCCSCSVVLCRGDDGGVCLRCGGVCGVRLVLRLRMNLWKLKALSVGCCAVSCAISSCSSLSDGVSSVSWSVIRSISMVAVYQRMGNARHEATAVNQ